MKLEIVERIGSYLGILSSIILLSAPIFYHFINEPNPIFLKPDNIVLRNYKFDPNGDGYIRLATPMSYINEDSFGKNAIVT